jgi:hypothetical protein
MKGCDPDGIAQTELDHFGNCPVRGHWSTCETWRRCWRTFMMLRLRLAKAQRRRDARDRCSDLRFDE